ncbi:MAG: hypothetical protein ACI8PD_000239 [Nitrospinales bacterium]|jgi:hypothetical protein
MEYSRNWIIAESQNLNNLAAYRQAFNCKSANIATQVSGCGIFPNSNLKQIIS